MSKTKQKSNPATAAGPKPLRVGFVPLTDCAPLVMARELGLFAKYGITVQLQRELGWATIRDKILFGELDAAHAVAGMPFAASLGLSSVACECVSALVLSLHGNAITLSRELWDSGVRDAGTLRDKIGEWRGRKMLTFGVVFPFSSHNFLLRQWLASAGIQPHRDARIEIVPPPQMFANLKAGNLDGYCVGEPWNSVAVSSRIGWCAVTSAQLAPGHPEKVLMVRRRFAEERASEHLALIAALIEACAYCDRPENASHVMNTLARREYLNLPASSLGRSLCGAFDFGFGRVEPAPDFHVFHRNGANVPSPEKAAWVLQQLHNTGLCKEPLARNFSLARSVFRQDLYEQGVRFSGIIPTTNEDKSKPQYQFAPA